MMGMVQQADKPFAVSEFGSSRLDLYYVQMRSIWRNITESLWLVHHLEKILAEIKHRPLTRTWGFPLRLDPSLLDLVCLYL